MPTYWTKTLIPTARQDPADSEVPSHQLMLRAGFIRRLGSGMYSYLPLGLRSLHKVMAIIREEMDRSGAVEIFLPTLQPVGLWESTGRRADYGEVLFVVTDRHGREQVLGPTHEEVITDLVGGTIESYKQLPITLYQIQTKFRDEFRPRFGVLRSREFQMKDAYSFDIDVEGLEKSYRAMYDAYRRIFDRCGLPYEIVEAESGEMGGRGSEQFTVPTPTGEDTIFISDRGNYAANLEKCATGDRPYELGSEPTGELEQIHTPNCLGIDDVCDFFKKNLGTTLKAKNMFKSLVYVATRLSDAPDPVKAKEPWYVLAIVRGDHDVNEEKLRACLARQFDEPAKVVLAPDELAKQDGWVLGFVGPHAFRGRDDTYLLIDPDAAQGGFWVTGANAADHHVKHFNWQRDLSEAADGYDRVIIADIRNAVDGDPSPQNDGGALQTSRGIEVGQVFKLGTKYTKSLHVECLDESNQRRPIVMGCYGIGVNRILAAAIEHDDPRFPEHRGHDENGIIWPASIAPYAVLITPIKYEGAIKDIVNQIAADLEQTGHDVLVDDRNERPGVKFKDADLVGIPLRITIGEKGLADGKVELKARNGSNGPRGKLVPLETATIKAAELLKTL